MLSLGNKYTIRDQICDVNYCAPGAKLRYESYNVNDVNTPFINSH